METHISLATSAIYAFGNEEQQKRYVPDLASGRKLASFALTEAKAGTDAAMPILPTQRLRDTVKV